MYYEQMSTGHVSSGWELEHNGIDPETDDDYQEYEPDLDDSHARAEDYLMEEGLRDENEFWKTHEWPAGPEE